MPVTIVGLHTIPESHPDVAQGGSDGWCSPRDVTEPMAEFFGGRADCDPCSNARSIVKAVTAYTENGLVFPWMRKTYENPPFSKTDAWTWKALHEMTVGNVLELIRLTPVSTATVWWAAMAAFKRNPRFLFTKRLKFRGDTATQKFGARFDTVLTYFGPRVRQFEKAFAHLERWKAWGR